VKITCRGRERVMIKLVTLSLEVAWVTQVGSTESWGLCQGKREPAEKDVP
jgi:hypothetical protein